MEIGENSNIGHICPEHAHERRQKWQQENRDTVILPGDYVKIAFTDVALKVREHMWVKVMEMDFPSISGLLSNEPMKLTNWEMGDEVKFTFSDIEDHISE